MICIFHGDSIKDSRNLLQAAIQKDKGEGREINFLDGEKLAPRDLESTLGTANLFAPETLVIEGLLGRLRSKDKDACIEQLAKYTGDKHIFLWDKKEITKLNLAKLATVAKISRSAAPTALFTFCESIEPGNVKPALSLLHQAVEDTEDIVVATMLARQVSYLIMMKSGTSPKFAPWQIGKLKTQAAKWSEKQLEDLLVQLLAIDEAVKTGQTKLSYLEHLDMLLVRDLG